MNDLKVMWQVELYETKHFREDSSIGGLFLVVLANKSMGGFFLEHDKQTHLLVEQTQIMTIEYLCI